MEASVPFFRFAEDYLVEPTSGNSWGFAWTIAIEPRALAGIASDAGWPLLETAFRDTRRHYHCP